MNDDVSMYKKQTKIKERSEEGRE